MDGETDLLTLLKSMKPRHHAGEFVFCKTGDFSKIPPDKIVMLFREEEAVTLVINKTVADEHALDYSFVAAWITLTVHSSLEAVGLTAAFSKALADQQISCNVVAAFYHDHIFVPLKDTEKAMRVLTELSK